MVIDTQGLTKTIAPLVPVRILSSESCISKCLLLYQGAITAEASWLLKPFFINECSLTGAALEQTTGLI